MERNTLMWQFKTQFLNNHLALHDQKYFFSQPQRYTTLDDELKADALHFTWYYFIPIDLYCQLKCTRWRDTTSHVQSQSVVVSLIGSTDWNSSHEVQPWTLETFCHWIMINRWTYTLKVFWCYRSGTVNSKSFVGKVLLRIKWIFELINAL